MLKINYMSTLFVGIDVSSKNNAVYAMDFGINGMYAIVIPVSTDIMHLPQFLILTLNQRNNFQPLLISIHIIPKTSQKVFNYITF